MPEVRSVYINTGPLLAFARTGHIELLLRMPDEFVVTSQVATELRVGGEKGMLSPDVSMFRQLEVENIDTELLNQLHAGEASVIQAARRHQGAWVSIDEKAGRRVAHSLGLPLRGTLGILVDAKKLELISAVAPIIESMRSSGSWFSQELVNKTLRDASEG